MKLRNILIAVLIFAGSITFGQSVSMSNSILLQNQTVLTTYRITDLDSLVTFTPTFAQYFDASIFQSGNDSCLISVKVDGGNDSARVILFGATSEDDKGNAIDTLATNKTTFMQQRPVITEAGKYTYPFWAFKVTSIQTAADAIVTVYIWNTKKFAR